MGRRKKAAQETAETAPTETKKPAPPSQSTNSKRARIQLTGRDLFGCKVRVMVPSGEFFDADIVDTTAGIAEFDTERLGPNGIFTIWLQHPHGLIQFVCRGATGPV